MSKIEQAYNYMCGLISGGAEYPDALFRATQKYSVDSQELQDFYDRVG